MDPNELTALVNFVTLLDLDYDAMSEDDQWILEGENYIAEAVTSDDLDRYESNDGRRAAIMILMSEAPRLLRLLYQARYAVEGANDGATKADIDRALINIQARIEGSMDS